jgi:hypothetical protein
MQFQLEFDNLLVTSTPCLACEEQFEPTAARVIVCDQQGNPHGEICPHCGAKGLGWLATQFQSRSI